MADLVVTVPRAYWRAWIAEGGLPGAAGTVAEYGFRLPPGERPPVDPGERVYVVAWDRVRGYAPLLRVGGNDVEGWVLVRAGGAAAVTIADPVRGFTGWRVRWWRREDEQPFERWRDENPDQGQLPVQDTGAGAISGPPPMRRWLAENCPLCKGQRELGREASAHAHQLDENCPFCEAFKVWPRGPRGLRHPERICVACGKTWHPEDLVFAAAGSTATPRHQAREHLGGA